METHLIEHFLNTCKAVGFWLIERLPYANSQKECTGKPGLYFIFRYGELVYVGQSICIKNRLNSHRSDLGVWGMASKEDPEYITVRVLVVPNNYNRIALESAFIGIFMPKYNRAGL